MNIMKLMFVGAILASSTNLIFIGLVRSGQALNEVTVNVAGDEIVLRYPDETGAWKVQIPERSLEAAEQNIQASADYSDC